MTKKRQTDRKLVFERVAQRFARVGENDAFAFGEGERAPLAACEQLEKKRRVARFMHHVFGFAVRSDRAFGDEEGFSHRCASHEKRLASFEESFARGLRKAGEHRRLEL